MKKEGSFNTIILIAIILMPSASAQTASIDQALLDSIDSTADDYYNSNWAITLEQYKAWIATIAWGEGLLGGYSAHSQCRKPDCDGTDMLYHYDAGSQFRFSTGIGPFQLDRGGSDNPTWDRWPTIDKIDYSMALKSVLKRHYNTFGSGSTLASFSASSLWYGVDPSHVALRWNQVTGTVWNDHKNGRRSLDWPGIKASLAKNARSKGYMSYENNVKSIGSIQWNIRADDNIFTDSNKQVIFNSLHPTWHIISRSASGTILFSYYYTYNPINKIEVWTWDNSPENDKFRYIFVREYSTGPYPEHSTSDWRTSGFTLSHPAIADSSNNPNIPSIPSGPTAGAAGTPYSYSTSATDPNGDQVKYTFDWGDGTTYTTGFVNSGATSSASHSWSVNSGSKTFYVKAKSTDISGLSSDWSSTRSVTITASCGNNKAPTIPSIPSGQTSCITGVPYAYSTSAKDPEGNQIKYTFRFGSDETITTGFFNSGEVASVSHTWNRFDGDSSKAYVYATAVDSCGKSSESSNPLVVSVTNSIIPPTVTNDIGATSVTTNSARLNGEITDTGGKKPSVTIYWGTNDGGTTPSSWQHNANLGTKGKGTYSYDASPLTPGTTYYYRSCATNSAGTGWASSTVTFATAVIGNSIDKLGNYKGNGIWAVDYNGNGKWDGTSIDRVYAFGSSTDQPVVGDWNGDGKDELGNYKGNGIWAVDYNGNGKWDGTSTDRVYSFGSSTDQPVVGDWNGDGKDELGNYKGNGVWALDFNGNGAWDGVVIDRVYVFGISTDKPVVGRWK